MSSPEGTTRVCAEVPDEINAKLKVLLPWGQKSEVLRSLIDVFIAASAEYPYIADALMKGHCKLVVQNLNKGPV